MRAAICRREGARFQVSLVVYNIVEGNGRKYWHRIGRAFVNQDRSVNVVLNSLPLDGKLHIRKDERQDNSQQGDRRNQPSTVRRENADAMGGGDPWGLDGPAPDPDPFDNQF
jgi:hypothetical protein